MKLHADTRDVLKGNIGQETTFSIKATSKAFQILSSGLYSNKILAIIRELSCNAYDAHVAAKNASTPIEIFLPTYLKPVFSVKDYGIGLDHEGITQLYTTYFESTKQDSNDFIGALGLGSKSPFSYVSGFNVVSRFNGTKRLYTAFINENGLPSITMTGEESTTEPNGLQISLPVKRQDIDTFHREAKKALMYFNPMPTVHGVSTFEPYKVQHSVAGSNWKVRDSDYYANMKGPFILQGFVAYPIDAEQLKQHNISSTAAAVLGVNVDIVVPMGDVEVAASREALSYDPRTIQNLLNHLEVIAKEMRATIQSEYDKCSTAWEAACLCNKYAKTDDHSFREIYNKMHSRTPFTWKNQNVSEEILVICSDIKATSIIRMSFGSYGDRRFSVDGKISPDQKEEVIKIPVKANTLVVVDDLGKGVKAIVENYLHTLYPAKRSAAPAALIIQPVDKKVYKQEEIDLLIDRLGNPPFLMASTLPKVVSDRPAYTKRDAQSRLSWKGFPTNTGPRKNRINRTFSRLCWNTTVVDLTEGGFYVPIERFTVLGDTDGECAMFDLVLSSAKALFNVDTSIVYGFNEKERVQVQNNPKWINLFDHIEKEFVKLNVDEKVINVVIAEEVIEHLDLKRLLRLWPQHRDVVADGSFKQAVDAIYQLKQNSIQADKELVGAFIQATAKSDLINQIQSKKEFLTSKWVDAVQEHEMLKLIDWYKVDSQSYSMIFNYINLVSKNV